MFAAPMPDEYRKSKKAKPRGVSNRNRALLWLRENATDGVFYFADDDNTYDINIFEQVKSLCKSRSLLCISSHEYVFAFFQMRYTKKVSMWPVGLVTKLGVSSPIVKGGNIEGFYDGWIGGRKYPVDMAGFAVSVKFLHERPQAKMPYKPGYEEDGFLKSLAPLDNADIQLLANNCSEVSNEISILFAKKQKKKKIMLKKCSFMFFQQILTWHTQTKSNHPAESLNMTKYGGTNLVDLDKQLVRPIK